MLRKIKNILTEITLCAAWLFLWPDGRLSRRGYIFGSATIALIITFVLYFAEPTQISGMQTQNRINQAPLALLMFGTVCSLFALSAKRLHDFGWSAYGVLIRFPLALRFVIPILCLVFFPILFLICLVMPGEQFPNKYGDPSSILKSVAEAARY